MKKQSNTPFAQISRENFKNLTVIVKETLGTCTTTNARKIFSVADLWNIQRQRKSFIQRRYAL